MATPGTVSITTFGGAGGGGLIYSGVPSGHLMVLLVAYRNAADSLSGTASGFTKIAEISTFDSGRGIYIDSAGAFYATSAGTALGTVTTPVAPSKAVLIDAGANTVVASWGTASSLTTAGTVVPLGTATEANGYTLGFAISGNFGDANPPMSAVSPWTQLANIADGLHPNVLAEWAAQSGAPQMSIASGLWAGIAVGISATPKPGVFADWNGDGAYENAYSEITSYVASWRITRGGSPQVTGGGQPGNAQVTLNNPQDTDLFNPENAAGPLYGKLRDGVAVWIGVDDSGGFSGTAVHGLFGGRIVSVTPVPQGGSLRAPTVELTLEDDLARLARVNVNVATSRTRSQHDLRAAILSAGTVTSTSLPPEIETMPMSGGAGLASGMLDELNRATGSRHFVSASDGLPGWTYTARDRMWGLSGSASYTLDSGAQHVTGMAGWQKGADTVANRQRVTFTPVEFTEAAVQVWQAPTLPLYVAGTATQWASFDDYVDSPTVSANYTGTVTTSLTSFGTTALVTLTGTATVTSLGIFGSLARRFPAQTAQADDAASQADVRGVRAGADVSSDMVGTLDEADGLAGHVVWRYAQPQARPTVTVQNWTPQMFDMDLFDVVSVTSSQLQVTGRLFEVVGLTLESDLASPTAVHHAATYTLQESRVQATTSWFQADVSTAGTAGTDILGY